MKADLRGAKIGVAMTGSFCTFSALFAALPCLAEAGAELQPILSYSVSHWDTRFFTAAAVRERIEAICGRRAWTSVPEVEPVGPRKLFDLLLVAPCTGNSCAKLAAGIADTPVTLACKSHLRNDRPVLLGISSNDALSANAANLGALLSRRNFFFVPFGQDDPAEKPASLVFFPDLLMEAAGEALRGRQLQPLLRVFAGSLGA